MRSMVGRGAHARSRDAGTRGLADDERARTLLTERARSAHGIDTELRVACRTEAASRLELGMVARELLRRRAYRRLGFVRLADYARERLGLSARTLQAAAWVATRLDALPHVATAFDRSELSWTQVRAICATARPENQEEWLARARASTVEELEEAAAACRNFGTSKASGSAAKANAGRGPDPDADDDVIDDEPVVPWRIACPARVRALWRRALELASRVAGEPLTTWRAAELIAAEAFSGRPAGIPFADRAILTCLRIARRGRRCSTAANDTGERPVAAGAEASASAVPERHPTMDREPVPTDPFALDLRAIAAVRAIRTSEPRIGRLLRIVADQRVYRAHGFDSLAAYVRERLGISARKTWALLKVERGTRRGDAFARAYDSGALSWVQALTLLPVVDRENAGAWLARAEIVTVRRLVDEVSWVLEARDLGGASATFDPPPLDAVLTPIVQIGAHGGALDTVTNFGTRRGANLEVRDAEIRVRAPASVVALMRETLDAFAEPGASRWSALERVLLNVIAYWEATPRHRDPIFARDGWRCAVPGCSSRRNLHDHHLRYRSRGGGNEHDNRVAVCAAHHLHGIHEGVLRAWGSAPREVHWQLGVRSSAPPLLAYVGDRLCVDAPTGTNA
jgi:hypothetical protein